jgi:isopenicillin N synthase-like dioxygenase
VTPIPAISLAAFDDADALASFDAACRDWGLFHLTDHGIEPGLLAATLFEMRRFFALPEAAKRAIERTEDNPWGYYDRELTKNVRDWKEILDIGPADGPRVPQWPEGLPGFRTVIEEFSRRCESIANRLVGAIATSLETEPATLIAEFTDSTGFLRLNHYPPCPDPAPPDSPTVPDRGRLGIGHHTDAGAVTVLLQDDRPGLQVEKDGRWFDVVPVPGALVVNLGDIVQVWSNDRFRAPLHRVLAHAARERYSAPYFHNPSYATVYAPLPSVCSRESPRYRPIRWGEFRSGRAAGDYADRGEEIQIAHFRLETT